MVVYTGIGLIGLSFTHCMSYLPSVPSAGIVWFLAFFLIGFLVIACARAVAGALASRTGGPAADGDAASRCHDGDGSWSSSPRELCSRCCPSCRRSRRSSRRSGFSTAAQWEPVVALCCSSPGRRHRPRRRTALPTLTAPDLRQAQHQAVSGPPPSEHREGRARSGQRGLQGGGWSWRGRAAPRERPASSASGGRHRCGRAGSWERPQR